MHTPTQKGQKFVDNSDHSLLLTVKGFIGLNGKIFDTLEEANNSLGYPATGVLNEEYTVDGGIGMNHISNVVKVEQ
jgi:pentose-5-phosphate-3-epimerase